LEGHIREIDREIEAHTSADEARPRSPELASFVCAAARHSVAMVERQLKLTVNLQGQKGGSRRAPGQAAEKGRELFPAARQISIWIWIDVFILGAFLWIAIVSLAFHKR
jgi:hypothetical protein